METEGKTVWRKRKVLPTVGILAVFTVISMACLGQAVARTCPTEAASVDGECVMTIGHGATLWRISRSLAPTLGVPAEQIAARLHRDNPEAFINGDINRLRLGEALRIPSPRTLLAPEQATVQAAPRYQAESTRARVANFSTDSLGDQAQSPIAEREAEKPESIAQESSVIVILPSPTAGHQPLNSDLEREEIDALTPLVDDLKRTQRNPNALPDILDFSLRGRFSLPSESLPTEPNLEQRATNGDLAAYRPPHDRPLTLHNAAVVATVSLIGVILWAWARRSRTVLLRAASSPCNRTAADSGHAAWSTKAGSLTRVWKASERPAMPLRAATAGHGRNRTSELSTAHLLGDLKGRTARGTAVTLVAQAIKFGLQLTSVTVLARLLTPADFGLVAMVTVVTGLLDKFRDGGLSMATVQRDEISQEQVSNLFWINLGLGVVLTTVTIGLSPILAAIYQEPRLVWIGTALAGSFLIASLAVQHEAILNRQMLFAVIARIDVTSMAVGIAAAILAAWGSWGYWSLVVLTMTTGLCRMVLVWLASEWRPSRFQRGTGVRPLLHFGMNLTGANFVGYFASNLTPFVIGLVGGAQQLGYYNRANTLMAIPSSQLLPPVMSVAQPALCRVAADAERFGRACLSLIRKVSLLAMFVTVSMVGMADWIVLAFLGPAWESTIGILRLLAIFALVEPLAAVVAMMLIADGHAGALLVWKVVSLIIVCLSALIGSGWGVEGIVAGYALSGLFIRMPLLLWFSSRYLPIRFLAICKNVVQLLCIALVSLVSALELRAWLGEIDPLVGLIVMALTTAAVYFSVCLVFVAPRADLVELLQLPKQLLRRTWRGAYVHR